LEVRVVEVRALKIGSDKRRFGEIRAFKVCVAEVSSVQTGPAEVNTTQVTAGEVGAFADVG